MGDVAWAGVKALEGIQRAFEASPELEAFGQAAAGVVLDAFELAFVRVDFHRSGSLATIGAAGEEPADEDYTRFCAEIRDKPYKHETHLSVCFGRPESHAYGFPMRHLNRPVGFLIGVSKRPLQEEPLRVLGLAAEATGKCCSLAVLMEQLELQTAEFSTIVEIGKAMSARLDVAELLSLLANTALQLTRGETATISLAGAKGTPFEVAAACGVQEETIHSSGLGDLAGVVEEVGSTGQPLLIPVVADLADADDLFGRNQRGITSVLATPLKRREQILGVLTVEICEPGRAFTPEDLDLLSVVTDQAGVALENARLYGEMQDLYVATIRSLAYTIEAKDRYTRGHSDRVTDYAVAIAERMGFTAEELSTLRFAGILHDIGKIAVSEEILNKPGKLTALEREIVQTHPAESARIIRPIGFLKEVVPIVEHHHEWYDGSGYNYGLSGEDIPRGARILAVADAFEAMTSDRPYHAAMPWPDAIAELKRGAGSQFDPQVVEVFVGMILESLDITERA